MLLDKTFMIHILSHRGFMLFICALSMQLFFLGCVPKNLSTLDRYNLANQLYQRKKYNQAAKLYTRFLLKAPRHPLADHASFNLGRIYQKQKQYQRAILQFKKIIRNYPHSLYVKEAQLEIGVCYFHLQRYDAAIPLFQKYLGYNHPPREAETVRLLADSYFAIKQYQKALDEYIFLKLLTPSEKQDAAIFYRLSLCQIYLKQYKQAIIGLNSLLYTDYANAHQSIIQGSLAKAALGLNHPLEAIDHLLKARQNAKNSEELAQYEEHLATIIQDQLDQEDLQSLIKKWGESYPADLALIQSGYLWQRKSELVKAKQAWEQFLATFPDHPQKKLVAQNLKELNQRLSMNSSKIGCIAPTSGDYAAYGDKVVKGVKLALEEYNRNNHSDIQLVLVDSRGNPEYAKNGVKLLVEKEHVAAIIGPLLSSEAYAIAPVIDELGVCVITPTASGKGIPESSPYFFRDCLTNQQQGKALAQYAVKTLGLKRFGILYPNDPYGIELMQIFCDEVENFGGKIEIIEFYEEGETDFRNQVERINMIHPDGLFVPSYPEQIVLIAPQVPFYDFEEEKKKENGAENAKQEEKKAPIQLLGCDGWYAERVISQGGKYVNGAVFTSGFFKESTDPLIQDFIYKYRKKYGCSPDLVSAQAYDAANILLLALVSEKLTRVGLRESLAHTRDFYGVTGRTSFLPSGEAIKKTFILTIRKHHFVCPP